MLQVEACENYVEELPVSFLPGTVVMYLGSLFLHSDLF